MDVKLCKDCGETKPKTEFSRHAKAADGLHSCCRECQKKHNAAKRQRYREANVGRDPFDGSLKWCPRCKKDLPRSRDHWSTAPSQKDGLQSCCLMCQSSKNSDLIGRIDYLWGKESRNKRTKQRGDWVDHGKGEWLDLVIAQKCRCALTGERLTVDNVSIDHIIPVAKGGTNELSNLRLLTKRVNNALWDSSDEDFISLCKRVLWWHRKKKNPGGQATGAGDPNSGAVRGPVVSVTPMDRVPEPAPSQLSFL